MASFWNDVNVEPKRQFRWYFSMSKSFSNSWVIKSVDKPKATVGVTEHKFFGYTYKYPGNVTWEDINITLVDPANPDSVTILYNALVNSGWKPPSAPPVNGASTISKARSTNSLGSCIIRQTNAAGDIIEQWNLTNPILRNADFGGNLSYDNEGLIEVKLTLAYDYATLAQIAGVTPLASTII